MTEKRFKPLLPGLELCLYCGFPKQAREHILPWTIGESPYWVPSCRRCNKDLKPGTPSLKELRALLATQEPWCSGLDGLSL